MPAISICKIPEYIFVGSLWKTCGGGLGYGYYFRKAIDCIKKQNASKYIESIKFMNPLECKL